MNISNIKSKGRYLKAVDVESMDPGRTYKVTDVTEEELTDRQGRKETKPVMHFDGDLKPLVLNATNIQLMFEITADPETDNWIGTEVRLYTEPTPMGRGVRLRGAVPSDEPAPTQLDAAPF